MFKYTQSITNSYHKRQLQTHKSDLFDLLDKYSDNDDEDIQTYEEFKQWANSFPFKQNELNTKIDTDIMKPKIKQGSSNMGLNRKIQSLEINNVNDTITHNLGFQMAGNKFLEVIQQNQKTNPSQKVRRRSSQNYSLGMVSPSDSMSYQKKQQEIPNDNSSLKKSSAHSSRSFNGFDLINQYEIREKLGSGAFSNVYLCIDIHTQKKFAMKVLEKKNFRKRLFRKNSVNLADNYIENQIAILKKMEHPYITKLYQVIVDQQKEKSHLIIDYCANGFINENKKKEEQTKMQDSNASNMNSSGSNRYKKLLQSECRRYFRQIVMALDYIHNTVHIAHRDIKPQNILLSNKDEVKISDFGLGTEDIEIASKSGTKNFLPPEAMKKQYSGNKTNIQNGDIWASGITLLVMLTGKNLNAQIQSLPEIINNLKQVSIECKDFLTKCLQVNPEKRIKAEQMLKHPWINIQSVQKYEEIVVSKEDEEKAIISKLNREILEAVTFLKLN